jgi:hypothetical protein
MGQPIVNKMENVGISHQEGFVVVTVGHVFALHRARLLDDVRPAIAFGQTQNPRRQPLRRFR